MIIIWQQRDPEKSSSFLSFDDHLGKDMTTFVSIIIYCPIEEFSSLSGNYSGFL